MIAIDENSLAHFTRSYEEWWFRPEDIASFQTRGEHFKPVGWSDEFYACLYIKGQHEVVWLREGEWLEFKRKLPWFANKIVK